MSLSNIILETEIKAASDIFKSGAIEKTHQDLGIQKGVIYYIVTDDELLEINNQSLNHDYYTDIITFDYSDDEDIEHHEILISWDRIKDNASIHQESIVSEFHRVCFHGLLHIAGYTDDSSSAKQKMRSLENHYLALHCST